MRLSELLSNVPGILGRNAITADPEITAPISEDSRLVTPGGIFVARVGAMFDGHTVIQTAVDRGAAAVVGQKAPADVVCRAAYIQVADPGQALAYLAAAYEGFPGRKLVLIGVTGTDGKTTTTNLIYNILKQAGLRAGMISTINAVLGDEQLETGLHVTTPTAPEVQHYLARMVEAGLTHCVLEVTSHGLAQGRVAAVDFDVAVITNIQHEHLDFHGSWENYRDAKALLFRSLMSSQRKSIPKLAVVNLDDSPSADFLLSIPADAILRYAIAQRPDADVFATHIEFRPDSTRLAVQVGQATLDIDSGLIGAFNVSNMLAAIAVTHGLGIPFGAINGGIEAVRAISGRMERIDEGQDFLAVVDFAHTPNGLRRALQAARQMIRPEGRVIAVFGSATVTNEP
jgi:UDP-N-acetylmuramoyl-L-alanyl-D-glutamate--2,6-diaminopimelate ligase